MRPGKRYRGSPARLRRLQWRRLTPRSLWILLVAMLCAALMTLACLASLS
ncbi:MAG TPA: hypothetical protein VF921_17265 [Vicinamibacterales bacterium]